MNKFAKYVPEEDKKKQREHIGAVGAAPVWHVTSDSVLKDEDGNLVTYDMVRRHRAEIYLINERDDESTGMQGVQHRPVAWFDAGDLGDGTAGVIYYYLGKDNPNQAPHMTSFVLMVPTSSN